MTEREAQLKAYDEAPDNSSDHERFCEGWEAAKEWLKAYVSTNARSPLNQP